MRHFRFPKGVRRELEEVSLGALIALLLVVGVSANVASAAVGGPGIVFWGKQTSFIVCTSDAAVGSNPCKRSGLQAPYYEVDVIGGRNPLLGFIPPQSRGSAKTPIPGGYILGFGVPGQAFLPTVFWMYGLSGGR